MAQDPNNLIWLDMEMTGLDPDRDRVIEIAMVATDSALTILAESPVAVVHQPDAVLDAMDEWNKSTHGKSGLVDRVRASQADEAMATAQLLEFMRQYVPERVSPMCGNSICQDRRFLHREMPQLEQFFHYRNLDVSSIKELAKRWAPQIMSGFQKSGAHLAMSDIRDSIAELRHYRQFMGELGGNVVL